MEFVDVVLQGSVIQQGVGDLENCSDSAPN